MEETELTKKAINEILKDMNMCKEEEISVKERKENPLVKPNKRFLGRTLNSIITHNKRESDRTQKQCLRKLRELELKRRKKLYRENCNNNTKEQPKRKIRVESTNEDHSSSDDEKRCQRQKKQKKKRRKRCNTSGNTSASEVKNRKFVREKCHGVDDHLPLYNEETTDEQTVDGYYVSPSLTYATLAINHHMNRLWLHQQLMNEQLFAKKKLVENSDSPSDITVSSNSDSSLNISINSSSAEEDKNGILTFYLSSDEENFNENLKHYDKIKNKDEQTYLSLNSKTTPQAKVARINSDVVVLSSSSSSSSEPENENKVKQPIGISESPKFIQNNFDAIYVDLTQE